MKAISFLGTSLYKETTYTYAGKQFTTEFFAQALPHFFNEVDEILVFVTPQVQQHPNLAALQARLGSLLHPVPIPMGQSEQDLWQIFERLTGSIPDGEQVIFDITNSFRSLPFLVFLAVAFLRTARKVHVAGVYYGAFEAPDQNGCSPVFNLTPFVDLLDWLAGTNRFVETGDGHALAELLRKDMPLGAQMGSDPEARRIGNNLKMAAQAIDTISLALRLARPRETMSSAAQLKETLAESLPHIQQAAPPFSLLAAQLTQEYGQFALPNPDLPTVTSAALQHQFALVNWYLERRNVIQAVTLAREWLVSLLAYRLDVPLLSYEDGRRLVEMAINNAVEAAKPRPNLREKSPYDRQVQALPEASRIRSAWSKLSQLRNDIAHCGMRLNEKKAEELRRDFEKVYPELAALRDSLLGEAQP